jgi:hypothetical protein
MSVALFGDVIGFAGALTLLAAYAYQAVLGRPADVTYYSGNLLGAILLGASLTIHFNLASLLLEIAWAAIALFGLVKVMRGRTL